MYNKVEICGINTSRLVTITEEEKRELLKKARGGDKKAREELINANLKLTAVIFFARRVPGRSFSGRMYRFDQSGR